jgi:mRNA interferase RelE/StbE
VANYKITFKKSVLKDLKSIPSADVRRILSCIDTRADNPRGKGGIKLSGAEQYRVRQGIYRVIYEIQDGNLVVLIIKVGHRLTVYKGV